MLNLSTTNLHELSDAPDSQSGWRTIINNLNQRIINELKVTLACGISVDFTGKLDEPIQFVGTLEEMLEQWQSDKDYIREAAFEEIWNRAIEYAHKALAGYIMRARMADEAVKLLIVKLVDELAEE